MSILHGCFFLPGNSVSKYKCWKLGHFMPFFSPQTVGVGIEWAIQFHLDYHWKCRVFIPFAILRAQISNIIADSFNERKRQAFFLWKLTLDIFK